MKIGLALSGGGTRAVAFHLGVLRRLAKANLLEQVAKLSTVSGGSLAAAVVFSHSGLRWPTSTAYCEALFPSLERMLTGVGLFDLGTIASSPRQWPRILSNRAGIVADLLQRRWAVRGRLDELPTAPEWLINTTCVETGKNWRFSKLAMGDWAFGHHYSPTVAIAEAAAASAAVPYVIGALRLKVPADGWYAIDPANEQALGRKEPAFGSIKLWDGGAYENLGLEPLYKIGRGMIGCDFIVVSDASAPLPVTGNSSAVALLRGNLSSPRLFDISSEQIRSLRTRMFVHALRSGEAEGALIRMGNSVRDIDIRASRERAREDYAAFQSDLEVSAAFKHPTNLSALSSAAFERVARHGFEVADATLTAYCAPLAPLSIEWQPVAVA